MRARLTDWWTADIDQFPVSAIRLLFATKKSAEPGAVRAYAHPQNVLLQNYPSLQRLVSEFLRIVSKPVDEHSGQPGGGASDCRWNGLDLVRRWRATIPLENSEGRMLLNNGGHG